jgi:hypothetical protein
VNVLTGLLVTTLWAQTAPPVSLEQALDDVLAGVDVSGRVEPATGSAALEAIGGHLDDEALTAHVAVARAGRASDHALAEALMLVVSQSGSGSWAAVYELGECPREARLAAARSEDALMWAPGVIDLATEAAWPEEGTAVSPSLDVALGAARLLAPQLTPAELRQLVSDWGWEPPLEPLVVVLLEEASLAHPDPAQVYRELAVAEIGSRSLETALGGALRVLVRRSPDAAEVALDMARSGAWGPGGAVLVSLPALPPSDWPAASDVLQSALANLSASDPGLDLELTRAVLDAGAALCLPEALWLGLDLLSLEPGALPEGIRGPAITAVAELARKDAATLDLFLGLLEDRERAVVDAAYAGLRRKSGLELPARAEVWRAWRQTQSFPELEEDDEERLARELRLRGLVWRQRQRRRE